MREESGKGVEKEKTVPLRERFSMSAFDAQGIARPAGRACVFSLVDSRVGHRESRRVARTLILSAHSAGMMIVAYGLRTRFFFIFC